MTIEDFEKLNFGVTYDNIVDFIDQVFPEYVQSREYQYYVDDRELCYVYLAGLSSVALKDLDEIEDFSTAIKLLKFTNHVINSFGDEKNNDGLDDLANLFGIEVFENLVGYKNGAKLAKEYLKSKSLQSFHDTVKDYHSDEFLNEYLRVFS